MKQRAAAARYEHGTRTIRSVPENYWLASIDSWDGAPDHELNAQMMAKAFELHAAAMRLIHAFGGNVPDWLQPEVDALLTVCADADSFPRANNDRD